MQGRAELRHALASPVSGSSSRMLWGHFLTWHAGHLWQNDQGHSRIPLTWTRLTPNIGLSRYHLQLCVHLGGRNSEVVYGLSEDYCLRKCVLVYFTRISIFNNQNIGNRGWGKQIRDNAISHLIFFTVFRKNRSLWSSTEILLVNKVIIQEVTNTFPHTFSLWGNQNDLWKTQSAP